MNNGHPRTILLIRNAAKQDFGGAETYQISLAKVLQQYGINPIIVTRSKKLTEHAQTHAVKTIRGWWWSKQSWNGKNVLIFPAYIAWQLMLTAWYVVLIVRTRPTALHIQSKDDFIAATIAGKLMGKPTVWTDHMDLRYIFMNIKGRFRNPLGKLVYWAARRAGHIIVISNNEHRLITSQLDDPHSLDKPIVIVKNGVLDETRNLKSKRPRPDTFTFCIASRITTGKGVGEAIQAFIKLQDGPAGAGKKPELAIYGDGPDINAFKKLAGSHPNIVFYGHQENAIQKISDSDVFMLPSYQEGFSIALLEATMLGKAIIASDVDSNPEIIRHKKTGLLVPVRDADSLASAMRMLLTDDKLRMSLETGARKNFEDNFNLEAIVRDKIIPLYLH